MRTSNIITDEDRLLMFDAVFVDWLGGPNVMSVVFDVLSGATYSDVEAYHGVSRSTAHGWVTEVRMKLRRVGFDVQKIEERAEIIKRSRLSTCH